MSSDLLLLAIRYLSNELPDDELAAFENRLASDQSAREAVAEAVELTLAVSRLPATTGDTLTLPRRRWSRRVRLGLAVAAAACLLVAVGLGISRVRVAEPEAPEALVGLGPGQPASVALAWSGLVQADEADAAHQAELLVWPEDSIALALAAAPVTGEGGGAGPSALEDELLPRWLVEAASLGETTGLPGTGTREN